MDIIFGDFIWDAFKDFLNAQKHGVDFVTATEVFKDQKRRYYRDPAHSKMEERFMCVGKVEGGILTVRFTYRAGRVRIFGAGYWRKGERRYYEEKRS